MAISLTAEAVVLAINSAIKLGNNLQRAYARSIKSRELFLPLPKFDMRPNADRAHRFFQETDERLGGNKFVSQIERLLHLFTRMENNAGLLPDEQEEYVDYYEQLSMQLKIETGTAPDGTERRPESFDDTRVDTEDLVHLLRIRQWESGKMPRNSPVKMVAGTLVEIGIDYFNQIPGALNRQSSFGRAMQHFLSAMDSIEFQETADLKSLSEQVVPKLFITAAEVMGDMSVRISSDAKLQAFIEATSRGIARDVFRHSGTGSDGEPVEWGQMLLRSTVKNAGEYVFNAPSSLFHTNEGASRLIQSTGGVLMDMLLSDPDRINIRDGFNVEVLDRLFRSTFNTLAEHPELIEGREGFRDIVAGVSRAMAEAGVKDRPHLLPELVRLIMAHTAGNLEVIMDIPQADGKYLLVSAVRELLLSISQPPPDGAWKPTLNKSQLLAMAEHVLDEVVTNPEWITRQVKEKSILREVLDATFGSLAALPKGQRLSPELLQVLLRINIRTVATSQAVLNKIRWGTDQEEKALLGKAMDLVFHFVYREDHVEPAGRIELLMDLMEYALGVVMAHNPDARGLMLVDLILFKDPDVAFTGKFDRALADQLINAALGVLREHPQLVTRQLSLQAITSGIAGGLAASSFRQPGILPGLLRLTLEQTARNVHLVIPSDTGEPKYLLVLALQQLLDVLSTRPDAGHWQPSLTAPQMLGIVENVLDFAVQSPQWLSSRVRKGTAFSEVIDAVFGALRQLPKEERLRPETLQLLLTTTLRTTASNEEVLEKIHWGTAAEERVLLNRALDLIFAYLFPAGRPVLERLDAIDDLLEYLMAFLSGKSAGKSTGKTGLLLIYLVLFEDPELGSRNLLNKFQADQLTGAAMRTFAAYPELITKDAVFQKIVGDVATALKTTQPGLPQLLPELLRLTLEKTADNIELVLGLKPDDPMYLLAVALQQTMGAIAQKPASGKWKPRLTPEQMLDVAGIMLDTAIRNPQWVGHDELALTLLQTVFESLELIPEQRKLPFQTVRKLIEVSLRAVSFRKQLLIEVVHNRGRKKVIGLSYALDGLFIELYDESKQSAGTWTLTQAETISAIIEYFLIGLSEGPVTRETIEEALDAVREAVSDLNNNTGFVLEDLLHQLSS